MSLSPSKNALALYKNRPALIIGTGDKIEIELADGKTKRVRDKDVIILHPGPLTSLEDLGRNKADPQEAWELLEGEHTNLSDLAELIYDDYTPDTAWNTWELINEGLFFEGNVDDIQPRGAQAIENDRADKAAKAAEAAAWDAFITRLKKGEMEDADRKALAEVERVALNKQASSRILKALDIGDKPEYAHSFLIRLGYWEKTHNPWPHRFGLTLGEPELPVPALQDETRMDLTHQDAWAIDDEGNQDPDDAIALDGDIFWVHIADVAALVPPNSDLDIAARERTANLYLPETTYNMLPSGITEQLGLGLHETSPALSFGMRLDENGDVTDIQITTSWVKVKRCTYEEADTELDEGKFAALYAYTQRMYDKRMAAGSATIRLPEVKVSVKEGQVSVRPLPSLRSRGMVTNAMLMAGEAAARYAQEHVIPFPYATQPPPDESAEPEALSEMWAYRKKFKRSQIKTSPSLHSGLGLAFYSQATSPLRRYLDLVVHQQLRAHLRGETLLDNDAILERLASADGTMGDIRKAERQSNRHWTLVYLEQQENWSGRGVLVDKRNKRGTVLIPDLAFDSQMPVGEKRSMDSEINLRLKGVNYPDQLARFEIKPV